MRNLKFRAWDKLNSKIGEVAEIVWDCKWNPEKIGVMVVVDGEYYWRKFEEVELMQFTGLTDKNGREIWEWDVVDFIDYKDIVHRGKVIWQIPYARWFLEVISSPETEQVFEDEMGSKFAWNELEVIGSIYEHPSLLKGDK